MKKTIGMMLIITGLLFTGCGTSTIGLGNAQTEVAEFSYGKVVEVKKVLISKTMVQTVGGAGIGAVGGALLGSKSSGKNAIRGGVIGAGVGAIVGYTTGMITNNNEQEAYRTSVVDSKNGTVKTVYLENNLRIGTVLEYVMRSNEATNINVSR